MKKEIILWAFLGASSLPVAAQTSYLEQIQVENRQVEKTESRSVRVSMDLLLDSLDMNRQHSLLLEPVILSADGSREQALTPIYINGKVRDKVVERSMWLNEGRTEGDTVRIRRRNGQAQSYHYEADVPFRRWMLNGCLDVRATSPAVPRAARATRMPPPVRYCLTKHRNTPCRWHSSRRKKSSSTVRRPVPPACSTGRTDTTCVPTSRTTVPNWTRCKPP